MLKMIMQAAAMAAAVLASTPALAGDELPGDRMPDVRVYYGDLDLSDPAGVARLDRRLAHAVVAACPSDNGVHELSLDRDIALCRAQKRAEIVPLRQTALASAAASPKALAAAR
jgi:UrcA family protein